MLRTLSDAHTSGTVRGLRKSVSKIARRQLECALYRCLRGNIILKREGEMELFQNLQVIGIYFSRPSV